MHRVGPRRGLRAQQHLLWLQLHLLLLLLAVAALLAAALHLSHQHQGGGAQLPLLVLRAAGNKQRSIYR